MFYYLEGTVAAVEPYLAVIDIGGAGYACGVTARTQQRLEIGKKAKLYTYCKLRDDAFDIFGFYSAGEKRCFELLIGVTGVGAKAALSILSSCTPESLALSVINGDERAITAAPGVGKKLAQRVILELKDKVSREAAAMEASGYVPVSYGDSEPNAKLRDAASGLAVLGYSQSEISAALKGVDAQTLTVEEIIKQVLKRALK
ncbi:MAG: Holliday junction branch migration protein RuvA [Oscillospiraceae bacterium]|jgi:Holliday junction DNA helicase RuvA|nr:Holliday junction branch migration protein RuvA [Oscillospiraceae bacterium]